jgi:hypothetical protein
MECRKGTVKDTRSRILVHLEVILLKRPKSGTVPNFTRKIYAREVIKLGLVNYGLELEKVLWSCHKGLVHSIQICKMETFGIEAQ